MNEILEEYKPPKFLKSSFRIVIFYFVAAMIAVLAGIYFGNTLFGKRSLDVMLDLRNQETSLRKEVKKFQEANSILQKEYFELIGLDPDNNK